MAGPGRRPRPARPGEVPAAPGVAPPPPPARNLRGLIAYGTQDGDIWVMHADGSARRQVTRTRHPAFDFDPSLSPDGRRVVFRTTRGRYAPDPNGTGVQGIFVADLDGTHQRQIQPPRGGLFPDWSPDGRRIAFASQRDGSFDVWVMQADGGGQHRLTSAADQENPVAWLPDGRIVYASFHGEQPLPSWYLMNPDGTGVQALPQLHGATDPIDWLANAG